MKRKIRLRRKELLALERKKKNRQNRILTGIFLAAVFGGTLATFLTPKNSFSDRENRALQEFPGISLERVLNGSFEKEYESYLSDQFPGRDGWIRVKTEAELLTGKQEINGVYYAEDHYLIESHKGSFSTDTAQRNIDYLANFVKEHESEFPKERLTVMLVPNAVEILKDKLPSNAPDSGERAYLEKIRESLPDNVWFDSTSVLEEHKDEYIYYRTDHHWTTLAAFYVYEAWAEEKGLKPADLSEYTVEDLTTDFRGTIESKVGSSVMPDVIQRFVKKDEAEYQVEYGLDGGRKTDDLYHWSSLEGKNKYDVFFGGNQAYMKITVDNGKKRKLLVLKDSYAHCFLPFTFEDFSEVNVIDIRYFNESLREYMSRCDCTDLLILYNAAGFAEDTSLARLQN